MRVPISWLRDYVPLEMPLDELGERLSVAAAEIEGIDPRGVSDVDGNLERFRVGKVVEAVKHPNADRLQLTKVDVGEGEPRSIVCGAGTSAPARRSPSLCRVPSCRTGSRSSGGRSAARSPTG